MAKLGIAIEETWDFFNEVYQDLVNEYDVSLFKRREYRLPFLNHRINRYLYHQDMQSLLEKNEVVFFEWASQLLVTATHLKKTAGIVTRLHRYEMFQWADRVNWDAVDHVILVSQAMQEEFISRFPDQAIKTSVSNESVSLSRFRAMPKSFEGNIGILCHLTPRKRVYELILEFYELLHEKDGFMLHIAGDKIGSFEDYYHALHYLVKKLGIEDKVIFNGYLSDPVEWYSKMDIFISNSYSEGLQVALIEAMASGCYCLSHRWMGVDELLPDPNLFFTGKQMRDKILRFSEMNDRDQQIEKELMRRIACEKCDIEKTKMHIRQIINETIERNRSRS